jgi:hypothetical protein
MLTSYQIDSIVLSTRSQRPINLTLTSYQSFSEGANSLKLTCYQHEPDTQAAPEIEGEDKQHVRMAAGAYTPSDFSST